MSMTRARGSAAALGFAVLTVLSVGCLEEGEGDEAELDELEAGPPVNPVVFVHGCPLPPGNNAGDALFFGAMIDFFKARGYPDSYLQRFISPTAVCDSNITQAAQLEQFIEGVRASTGAAKVDIVAHSMGALTSRLYLQTFHDRADDFVSVAGANHGSLIAVNGTEWQLLFGVPAYEGAQEMFPQYACQGQALNAADVQFWLNGCLTATGRSVARDETPGAVDYLSIRNNLDEIVLPHGSECLNQNKKNDCSDTSVNVAFNVLPALGPCGPMGLPLVCPGHVATVFNPAVMQRTYDFLSAAD
jgi:triacylglycerol lipase